MFVDVVMGIDLSLTGLGLVAVPVDWDMRWSRVHRTSLGIKLTESATPRDEALRRRALADDVARWASRRNVTHVWVEAYPMGGRGPVYNLHLLAELGGVVKDRLLELGLSVKPVGETVTRTLLMGALPPRDRKAVVFETLRQLDAGFANTDEADAFTVANFGLSELGAPFVTLGRPEREPQKRRKKAA